MVTLLNPRNETAFKHELKTWFIESGKGLHYVETRTGTAGVPDLLFVKRLEDGTSVQMHVEAKYIPEPLRDLQKVWNLLQGSQKTIMPKRAAAGLRVYLAVCIAGRTSDWYRLDPDQSAKALANKVGRHTCLALTFVGRRNMDGRWVMTNPNDNAKTLKGRRIDIRAI